MPAHLQYPYGVTAALVALFLHDKDIRHRALAVLAGLPAAVVESSLPSSAMPSPISCPIFTIADGRFAFEFSSRVTELKPTPARILVLNSDTVKKKPKPRKVGGVARSTEDSTLG